MSSIGETLRRERQKRNLDLDQISRELKITSRFLEAIEDERFDQLPAGVFVKSFVRQYATLLGLDADELAAEVQRALAPEPAAGTPFTAPPRESLGALPEIQLPRVEEWQTVGDRRNWSSSLPALALVVVVMLVCSGLYAFWQRARRPVIARETASSAQPVRPPAPPPGQPEPQAQPQAVADSAQAPAENAPTPAAAPPTAAPAANPPQTLPAVAAKPQPEPVLAAANRTDTPAANAPPPDPNADVHLELTAVEPVWVLARANGKYLFSGTIEANQTRALDVAGTLLLRVGNAGGLTITLNGKPIGAVGPKGQIRDVQFTSGGFQIVAAPKPPSPPGAGL
jgi:cytoskeleton protein RodZ